ncbi:hypothetical protein KXQ82_06375 [Mucilaginibacter sp. HMF5004]|uniref:hypothetical protein n=1 Tax=Mucilaginibacter rivuli TaxID=2857527 RepID=UPI001C5F635E|nr:hypothetical protein [Mucilaginibacter rivuli]MBW4889332.1 hypothetical protein [Mucilaginibacter rivuli]
MSPKSIAFNLLITCCLATLWACNHTDQQTSSVAAPPTATVAKPTVMEPFRYHKLIESSPGKYFDVLTWGRGKDSIGGYLILHSDSTGKKYTTITGDLEGAITDVFNTDMNMDGNPEILLLSKAKDTTVHFNIYAYEYRNGKGNKIDFPKLGGKSKTMYHGGDDFHIEQGNLVREFPAYDGEGKNAKPTGKKRILQYGIRDNEFTVKDITPIDSAALKPAVKDTVKKTLSEYTKKEPKTKPTETKSKSHKKEKHTVKKKHKKHRS